MSLESQILLCALPAARATVGGASGHPGQFYRGLTAPLWEPDLLALSLPEDSSRPAFIPRWSRSRDDILSRHLAHFFRRRSHQYPSRRDDCRSHAQARPCCLSTARRLIGRMSATSTASVDGAAALVVTVAGQIRRRAVGADRHRRSLPVPLTPRQCRRTVEPGRSFAAAGIAGVRGLCRALA